jgi:hypothetical protein
MNKLHILGGALVGLVVGAAGGYLFAKKQLNDKYADLADKEIAETKAYLNQRHKDTLQQRIPQKPVGVDDRIHQGPDDAVLEKVLQGLRYGPKTVAVSPPKAMNVFEPDLSPDDDEDEVRDPKKPYIITVAEWGEQDERIEKLTYTYYDEDSTLCDEEDNIVTRLDVVGEDHLERFGHRSGDPDTVFVRNEKLRMDFEIVRANGSYRAMVLGEE